jgi:hypothetical protein
MDGRSFRDILSSIQALEHSSKLLLMSDYALEIEDEEYRLISIILQHKKIFLLIIKVC